MTSTLTQPYLRAMKAVFAKFFADRGTHLAAMIAYFALLSFVPLLFLAVSVLGFAGSQSEESFLVDELSKAFPGAPVQHIVTVVNELHDDAATLGVLGAIFLAWASVSLFSALESAFNIVYGRPNRGFLHGKALAVLLLIGSLVTLFVGLLAGSAGFEILKAVAPGFVANGYVAYTLSVVVSTLAIFVFLVSVYYLLTNVSLSPRDVLPGAITSTVVLEATFQVLPVYLRASREVFTLQALGGPVLLLVWLYVMSNVIVFGAEVNWWRARPRLEGEADHPAGLA
jgi:membrane protein